MIVDADELTPVVENPCRWCGVQSEVIFDVPFPHPRWFDWKPFATRCLVAPSWAWCSVNRLYAGTMERRR